MISIRTNKEGDWFEVISEGRYSTEVVASGHCIGLHDLKHILEYVGANGGDEVPVDFEFDFEE